MGSQTGIWQEINEMYTDDNKLERGALTRWEKEMENLNNPNDQQALEVLMQCVLQMVNGKTFGLRKLERSKEKIFQVYCQFNLEYLPKSSTDAGIKKLLEKGVVNINSVWTHPEYEDIYGSLDGVAKGKVFEAKHTNPFTKEDKLIERYYAQVQHYMMVTGFSKAVLSVLYGNHNYKVYTIERDKPFQQKLEIACHLFWFHVMNDITPPEYVDFDLMGKIKNEHDIALHFGEEISSNSWLQGKLN